MYHSLHSLFLIRLQVHEGPCGFGCKQPLSDVAKMTFSMASEGIILSGVLPAGLVHPAIIMAFSAFYFLLFIIIFLRSCIKFTLYSLLKFQDKSNGYGFSKVGSQAFWCSLAP
jgi:hypothetical protein